MYGMRGILLFLLLSLTFGAASCSPMQMSANRDDLLSTGLVGWQQIGGQNGAWHYEGGVLYTEGGSGGWLATLRQYDDFVLSLEYRVPPEGNSGVFIRTPLEGDPAYTGMEIQILDDHAEKYRSLQAYQYTGSIYGVQAPSERAAGKAGQWQKMVIVARGSQVMVILNGEKIIDTDLGYYRHKLDRHPGLARDGGYIGLQNHGSRLEFRDVRIRELSGAK